MIETQIPNNLLLTTEQRFVGFEKPEQPKLGDWYIDPETRIEYIYLNEWQILRKPYTAINLLFQIQEIVRKSKNCLLKIKLNKLFKQYPLEELQ